MSLQDVKEVSALQRFLKHWVHNRNQDNEGYGEVIDTVIINGSMKHYPHDPSAPAFEQQKSKKQQQPDARPFPLNPKAKRPERPPPNPSNPQHHSQHQAFMEHHS